MAEVFELRPHFEWRGLGLHLPQRPEAVARPTPTSTPSGASACPGVRVADPKACQCGEVLKGVIKPWECKVFGTACTPERADRHVHGLVRGRLRRLLQLRALRARAGGGVMSDRAAVSDREQQILGHHRDRARPSAPKFRDAQITMAHGAGGKATQAPDRGPVRAGVRRRDAGRDGRRRRGRRRRRSSSRSPPTPSSSSRCASPAARSASSRSTAPSTTSRCRARGRWR